MGNPGVDQNYTIEKGYRYFDLLVVGGGGGGGTNSGGGGASGTIAFARNIMQLCRYANIVICLLVLRWEKMNTQLT